MTKSMPWHSLLQLTGMAETSFPDTDLISRLPVLKGGIQGVAMVASSKCKQETYSEEYYCHIIDQVSHTSLMYHSSHFFLVLSKKESLKRTSNDHEGFQNRASLSRFHLLSPSFTFWMSNLLPYGEDDTRNTHDLTTKEPRRVWIEKGPGLAARIAEAKCLSYITYSK